VTRTLTEAPVLRKVEVARATVVLTLAVELAAPPRPGQFAMVHPLAAGCLLPRPFSILSYAQGELEILVKDAGRGSHALCAMRAGDRTRVFAPLGSTFVDHPDLLTGPTILVAGGVGIVPLWWLAEDLHAAARPARALLGARTPRDLPRPLLERGSSRWEFWVEAVPQDDCETGLVTAGLRRALAELPDARVATCGPTPMMRAVHAICREFARPLWVCLEEQMGCGSGVCRACVIPDAHDTRMRTVCKDGPVFAVDTIQFAESVG
jgi:dihydroorotate dehydrogenase electron transfer subunit